jgi:hypothetical protein
VPTPARKENPFSKKKKNMKRDRGEASMQNIKHDRGDQVSMQNIKHDRGDQVSMQNIKHGRGEVSMHKHKQ